MMGNWKGDWGLGEWLTMIAAMVLFWGLLVGVVVTVLRTVRDKGRADEPRQGSTAEWDELLTARLARGEITEDEFQRGHELLHRAGHVT